MRFKNQDYWQKFTICKIKIERTKKYFIENKLETTVRICSKKTSKIILNSTFIYFFFEK